MDEMDPNLDLPEEAPQKRVPWVAIAVGAAFVLMGIAAFWLTQTKPNERARQAIVQMLEKELDMEKDALEEQRSKVVDLTQRLEGIKQALQQGQVENVKQAIAEYNKVAAEQRAEREKFRTLANQYNEKVAKLQKLQ